MLEKKMGVLVTGANGYIGQHVVKELLDKGVEVFAVDIANTGIDRRAHFLKGSIFEDFNVITPFISRIDVCMHLAWRNGFVHNADSHIEELWKHYHFLDELIKYGVKQLVIMGTMHEIGYWEGAIDENTPTNPTSKYGIAKNALRQLLISRAKESNTILQWCRCYYIMGDDIRNNSIFAKILEAEKEGKKEFPFTSGKNKYDFIDVDELAMQLCCVAMQTEVSGIINCCTGKAVSLAEQVEKFIKDNTLNIRLEYGKFPDREYDSPAIWGDNKKISEILKNGNEGNI